MQVTGQGSQRTHWPARTSQRLTSFLVLTALLTLSQPAQSRHHRGAQDEPKPGKTPTAQAGRRAIDQRDFKSVRQIFEALYDRAPDHQGLFDLGQLALAEGNLLLAQDYFSRYLSDPSLPSRAGKLAAKRELVESTLAQPRPASGKIGLSGDRGTRVRIDGRLRGVLPLSRPLLVEPGRHTLSLQGPDSRMEESVEVPVGRFLEITYSRSTSALVSSVLPAVLWLLEDDALNERQRASIERSLEDAIEAEHLSAYPRELAYRQANETSYSACLQMVPCQVRMALQVQLDLVLLARIHGRNGDWQLVVEVVDAAVGAQAARESRDCRACSLEKVGRELAKVALPPLLKTLSRPKGVLVVRSTPPGSEVRLGDRLIGRTPMERPLWVGRHEITIGSGAAGPVKRSVEIKEGARAEVDVKLSAH